MTANESRIYELETVLEQVLDCFEETTGNYYTEVEISASDGIIYSTERVTASLTDALENAATVLYNGSAEQLSFDFEGQDDED